LLEQLTRLGVHGRALDPRPSDIYPEHVHEPSRDGYVLILYDPTLPPEVPRWPTHPLAASP
ncbi:MAG TPA: hypothetical protein VFQ10_03275, partial [Rubrobacter sp.]|nr:hypothetical protein [Rubrobacter sp.]